MADSDSPITVSMYSSAKECLREMAIARVVAEVLETELPDEEDPLAFFQEVVDRLTSALERARAAGDEEPK